MTAPPSSDPSVPLGMNHHALSWTSWSLERRCTLGAPPYPPLSAPSSFNLVSHTTLAPLRSSSSIGPISYLPIRLLSTGVPSRLMASAASPGSPGVLLPATPDTRGHDVITARARSTTRGHTCPNWIFRPSAEPWGRRLEEQLWSKA